MGRNLIVAVPEWHQYAIKPQSFEDFCDMWDASEHGPLGLWRIRQIDKLTGEVTQEQWRKNALLDTGATAYLKNAINASGSAVSIFGQIVVTNAIAATTLSAQLAVSGVSPISVAATPAAIPANYSTTGGPAGTNTQLIIGYGTGQTQTCQVSAAVTQGAVSIGIQAVGGGAFSANATYPVGTNVLPQPNVGENPTTLNVNVTGGITSSFSGVYTNPSFTFSGAGAGNRQVVVSYTFSTTGTPAATAANYTEAWLINTAASTSVSGAGQCAVHITFMPTACNSTQNCQITITEKV